MSATASFLSGMVAMGFIIGGLFFFRFWRRTRDKLFLAFGFAFLLFAVNQAFVALSGFPREDQSVFYLLRFSGFIILIAAIIAKNIKADT
jgi:uncharacterized membrane protein YqgA involved in biofilm formation